MLGGFEPIPKFKRIFHPSEYEPKWAVVIIAPILLLFYILSIPRIIRRKLNKK
jgi:hypothetical protein